MAPLRRHLVVRTEDLGVALREGTRLVAPHALEPQSEEQFGWAFHAVDIRDSLLAFHSYRNTVRVAATTPVDYFFAVVLLRGSIHVSTEHGTADLRERGSACVVSPTDRFTGLYAPGTQNLLVKMPVPAVELACARLTGDECGSSLVFDLPAAPGATWTSAVELAAKAVDDFHSDFTLPPRLGVELERLIISSLLLGQPHSAKERFGQRSGGRAALAAAKVAKAIRSAPERDIDFADMAQHHGISLRTLQDGFCNHFGQPPSAFLRDVRLDMAHRLLSTEVDVSVTDVALSCGFSHLGRFARDYRRRYGSSPSETREGTRARCTAELTRPG
jgi:AraC-like DNA-binding protein